MLEAKDIMTNNVVCIQKNISIVDAVRLMSKYNITGIPVVEEDMTLIGILSEQDVLRLFHTYQDEKDKTVNDFMTQPAIHFETTERLLDVCYCLRDNSIRRVPVTSNGKVVGVISRSDILRCILQFLDKDTVTSASASNNVEPQSNPKTTVPALFYTNKKTSYHFISLKYLITTIKLSSQ